MTHLHICVPAITRGTLARTHELKIEEGNVVKKDSLLSLTILIDFFQIAAYLTLLVLNGIS